MLEWIADTVAVIALIVVVAYVWSAISARIPPKFELRRGGLDHASFGAWLDVKHFIVSEFRIGYVVEWELGHELQVTCRGMVEHGDDHSERTVHINFFGFRDAYKRSNVIGTADAKNDNVNVYLSLAPDHVRDIVHELRLGREAAIRLHGWQDEKSIKIDYFSMSPSTESASEWENA